MNILATISETMGRFVPANPTQFLAMRLAQRLGDEKACRHYAVLFEHYSEEFLLRIYNQCVQEGFANGQEFMARIHAATLQNL
jgi:hypothetical protein